MKVIQDGIVRRQETVTSTIWSYAVADRIADVGSAPYRLEVAQLSARFGEGLSAAVVLQGD